LNFEKVIGDTDVNDLMTNEGCIQSPKKKHACYRASLYDA